MQLQALRPQQGANLIHLHELLSGKGWRSALPNALPDPVLLCLALDFRRVEGVVSRPRDNAEGAQSSFAVAMYVIVTLLLDHPERVGDPTNFALPELALMRAFCIYQRGIEDEIVSRISGCPSSFYPEAIADEIVRCANECS